MNELPKESIGHRVQDYPRLERELEEARAEVKRLNDLLDKDPDVDWKAMAQLVFDAEAAAEEARQEAALWREQVTEGDGAYMIHVEAERDQARADLAEARQERDAAIAQRDFHRNVQRGIYGYEVTDWVTEVGKQAARIGELEAALRRIANDHNDGRYPDHRWMDWAQNIARKALQPTTDR